MWLKRDQKIKDTKREILRPPPEVGFLIKKGTLKFYFFFAPLALQARPLVAPKKRYLWNGWSAVSNLLITRYR